MSADLASVVARLEAVAARLETAAAGGGGGGGGGAGAAGGNSAVSDGYAALISNEFKAYEDLSNKIGGDVAAHAAIVKSAFVAQQAMIGTVATSKKPTNVGPFLAETSAGIQAACEFQEKNRRSKQFNHLSAIQSSIGALGWVAMEPKPAPYIKEMKDSGEFYANRVIKEFKGVDDTHVSWVRAWNALLTALYEYVKSVHTTGLVWNPKGGEAKVGAAAPPPPAAGGPPPPPPAGPPAGFHTAGAAASKPAGGADSRGALFASLSKGEGVTAGLKKVSKDQMTHKNPALRTTAVVKAKEETAAPAAKPKFGSAAVKKTPVLELQGDKKWVVEHQVNNKDIKITIEHPSQTVYIYGCTGSVIQLSGKVNSCTFDGCKKTALVVESSVSMLELINCQSVQVQVTGSVPAIQIEKTDGAQIYLSQASGKADIFTAKSSEMNISIEKADGSGEFDEFPVPEQFKTNFVGGKLVTVLSDVAA